MFRFGPIGDLLRWILELIYRVIPNYGWAVIVFTLLIRILLLPFFMIPALYSNRC